MKVYLLKNENSPQDHYRTVLSPHYDLQFVPLLTHSLHLDQTITFLTQQITNYQVIIVTSQRAVECLQQSIESPKITDNIRQYILQLPVYTIGPSTSKNLSDIGFSNIHGADTGNGHNLSELLLQQVNQQSKIIYFTGEIRKDIIPGNMRKHQMAFDELVVYSTQELNQVDPHKLIDLGSQLDWVIFFSSQGTKLIVDKIKQVQQQRSINVAVIGPTTNQYLLENDITVKFVCDKPTANDLLEKLKQYN